MRLGTNAAAADPARGTIRCVSHVHDLGWQILATCEGPMTTDKPSSEGGWHPDRQAVVIIHGIGEQRPMQTLRGFADAVLGVLRNGRSRFYNKPDMLSDT